MSLTRSHAPQNGLVTDPITPTFAGPPSISGLILGYGATPLTQVRRAAKVLATLLASLTGMALRGAAGQR